MKTFTKENQAEEEVEEQVEEQVPILGDEVILTREEIRKIAACRYPPKVKFVKLNFLNSI